MINHAYSLLVNAIADDTSSWPGSVFVEPDFQPLKLSSPLAAVWTQWFGQNPDRLMRNFRTSQLLSVIDASELREFLDSLDPRRTYLSNSSILRWAFGVGAHQYRGSPVRTYLGGEPGTSPEITGLCRWRWRIEQQDADTCVVRRSLPSIDEQTVSLTFTNGLSSPIPLHGTGYTLQFSTQSSDTRTAWLSQQTMRWPAFRGGGSETPLSATDDWMAWEVQADVHPGGLDTAWAEFSLPSESRAEVFLEHLGRPPEPVDTFRRLWESHPEWTYRTSGLVLAWIYAAERLRTGQA